MDPFGADPLEVQLEPALELSSYVAEVKSCGPGESAGYGRRFIAIAADEHRGDTDRLRRRLAARALRQREVLIAGRATAGRDREHGLRHGGPRRQPGGAAAAGRTGDPDRIERRAERITAEELALGSGRSTTRSHAGSRRGSRAATTVTVARRTARRCREPLGERGREHPSRRRRPRGSRRRARVGGRRRDPRPATRQTHRRRRHRHRRRPGESGPLRRACRLESSLLRPLARVRLLAGGGAGRLMAGRRRADAGPTLDEDLRCRDFTVNAIAEPLAGGEVIDPLGGACDVRARVLRAAGPGAFERDPLRVLRMVRMSVELGFEPDKQTTVLAAASAAALDTVSAERVFAELRGSSAASVRGAAWR